MAIPNRAPIYTKISRVLKKHYDPVATLPDRPVLEHLLYACCLENTHHNRADAAFANLQKLFYDWNEVRVTTVAELSECIRGLHDSDAAALDLKQALQMVFETNYSFDLELMRKQNIGKSAKQLIKYGSSPFAVAYVTQNALSGHAIPVDRGSLHALVIVGAISEAEAEASHVPGLERTVLKKKGVEYGSLLHQLGADLIQSPHSSKIRGILVEINSSAKDRFPKRQRKKEQPKPTARTGKAAQAKAKKVSSKTTRKKTSEKKTTSAKRTPKKKKAAL